MLKHLGFLASLLVISGVSLHIYVKASGQTWLTEEAPKPRPEWEECQRRVLVDHEFPAVALEDDGTLAGGRIDFVYARKSPLCTMI